MNKALLFILLSVCLLGMALIMLNERLHGDNPKPAQAKVMEPVATAENTLSHTVPFDLAAGQEVRGEASMVARRVEPVQRTDPRKESVQRTEPRKESVQRTESRKESVQRVDSESRKAERENARAVQDRKETKVAENRSEKRKNGTDSDAKESPAKENARVAEKKETKVEKKPEKKSDGSRKDPDLAVTNFVVFVRDNGATVRFDGNNDLKYKTLQMHNPERVLIEFEGKWDIDVPQIPKNEMVSQIRVARQTKKTRVVLDLKSTPRSCRFVQKRKENLDVRLDG